MAHEVNQESLETAKKTGRCARCHRGLKDEDSMARGLGPKCAQKVAQNRTLGPQEQAVIAELRSDEPAVLHTVQDPRMLARPPIGPQCIKKQ